MTDSMRYEANGWIKGFLKKITGKPRSEKIRLLETEGVKLSYWKRQLNKAFKAANPGKTQPDSVIDPIIEIITTRLASLLEDLKKAKDDSERLIAKKQKHDIKLAKLRKDATKKRKEAEAQKEEWVMVPTVDQQETKNSVLDPETGNPLVSAPVLARQTSDAGIPVARVAVRPPPTDGEKTGCLDCFLRRGGRRRKTRRKKTRYNRHNTRRKTNRGRKQRLKTRKGYKGSRKSKSKSKTRKRK